VVGACGGAAVPLGSVGPIVIVRPVWIDCAQLNIRERALAWQIAHRGVVAKVERLARLMGLSKTAVVERAIDLLAAETADVADRGQMTALLA